LFFLFNELTPAAPQDPSPAGVVFFPIVK